MEEITNAEYRQREGVSASDLKMISKSPLHFKYWKDHPEDKDSKSLLIGRAYHKWCLEPSSFYDEFAVCPMCDRRTKEGKEIYAKFLTESEGKDVLTNEEFDNICKMRDALYATPFTRELLEGQHEKSFFWTDEETGLTCKCRPDSFGEFKGIPIIVDLKTCASANMDEFTRSAVKLLYDVQASHYTAGMKAIYGQDYEFVFIAQEKNPPYAVNILQANGVFMKSGEETRRGLLETYKECKEKDEWPGYMRDKSINSLGVPSWLEKQMGYTEEGDAE